MSELDNLSLLIENEIHATHSISDETYAKIINVIDSVNDIHKPINCRDSRLKLILSLNPLSFKMFQYAVATMEQVLPEPKEKVINHISNVVLTKAFKYFPNNTEIYVAYAMRRIIDDRDKFIKECMEDKVINAENKSTWVGNYLSWLMFILILAVVINTLASLRRRVATEDEREELRQEGLNKGVNYKVNGGSSEVIDDRIN